MKIAVIYTGLSKTNINILENHKKYIHNEYKNIDTYVNTYDDDLQSLELIKTILQPNDMVVDSMDKVKDIILPKIQNIPPVYDHVRPYNAMSMFYKWYQSLCFLENKKYDIVLRNRLDITFTKPLFFIQNNSLNVPLGGDHLGGLMDLLAYGSTDIMTIYKKLYLDIDKYIMSRSVVFHPETLLRHHVKNYSIHIERFYYPIILRNIIFTTTAPTYFDV